MNKIRESIIETLSVISILRAPLSLQDVLSVLAFCAGEVREDGCFYSVGVFLQGMLEGKHVIVYTTLEEKIEDFKMRKRGLLRTDSKRLTTICLVRYWVA